MINEKREELLNAAIKSIQKSCGKESIRYGNSGHLEIDVLPSGSLALDLGLGLGGYPLGRIIEIFGPESSGKTTLALHAIAECQKNGDIAALIDTEHAFDPVYAENIGVKCDELLISQPDYGEQALEITESLVRSNIVKVIVIDSVAALVPKAELEGEMGDSHMGLQARLMSQALRKLTPIISKSNCIVIFINQIRQKIGVMFGNPETTTGGNALKFYSSIRIDVRRTSNLKRGEEVYGSATRIKIVKNKVAPPFKTVDLEIIYGQGISKISEIINMGVNFNLIQKSGSWYSIDNNKIGQGADSVKAYFESNPSALKKIDSDIRNIVLHKNINIINATSEDKSNKEIKNNYNVDEVDNKIEI